jgi:hypothetical protein
MNSNCPASPSLSWLLFFHSLPAKPAGVRAKIWRQLNRIGALKLKGGVYLLPASEEHRERLQWLITEVTALGGDGAFTESAVIEPLSNEEIIALFNAQNEERYRQLNEKFDEIGREIARVTGTETKKSKQLHNRINKLERSLYSLKKTDFFAAPYGLELQRRLQILKQEVDRLSLKQSLGNGQDCLTCPVQQKGNFREKTWVTRSNPFVDRMASAWLIKNYIDPRADFAFISEEGEQPDHEGCITYDIHGGDFSHVDNLCTFEVLIQAFGLKDPGLKRMAELVHALDLHDQQGRHPETEGVEAILRGIRQTAADSHDALIKGIEVFAALHAAFR